MIIYLCKTKGRGAKPVVWAAKPIVKYDYIHVCKNGRTRTSGKTRGRIRCHENKRCIEENKVRSHSFEDNDLNSQLNAKQLKRERPDLDVISPSNEMTNEIASSKQRESKTLPDIDPDFGVYKSISAITKDHKRSEKRRKMAKIRWLKPK